MLINDYYETSEETESETESTYYVDDIVTEALTENSESDYIYSQVSELNEYAAVIADNTAEIKTQSYVTVILIFAVICVIGVVCGLLGALTWRSNKNG